MSVLFFLFAFAPVAAADKSFDYYLPPAVMRDLLPILRKIPFGEKELLKTPHLSFTSQESYDNKGNNIVNRVHLFEDTRFEIWLMRQAVAPAHQKGQWNTLLLVVDKKAQPKMSYYLEMGHLPAHVASLPAPKRFSAACYACHASGPRVIRPQESQWTAPFTSEQKKRLVQWNQKIANHRVVHTYRPEYPPLEGYRDLHYSQPHMNEVLKNKNCVECHSEESEVRAPLLRQHGESIRALVKHKAMPLEGALLSAKEQACLIDWLDRPKGSAPQAGCNANGEAAVAASASKWIVDSRRSAAQLHVQTTLSSFAVDGFFLSGWVNCQGHEVLTCQGKLLVDLQNLKTGIGLRDRHLQELLAQGPLAQATVHLSDVTLSSAQASMKVIGLAKLQLKQSAQAVNVDLSCQEKPTGYLCEVPSIVLSLKDLGLKTPSYLGVTVEKVELKTQIHLTEL